MKRLTVEEFISRAKNLYGDKYDYSKVEYKNTETKVCIICPEHGEWWVTPHNFFMGMCVRPAVDGKGEPKKFLSREPLKSTAKDTITLRSIIKEPRYRSA